MGFQELQSLDTSTTISMGGVNKQTGKANPSQIEGYFLGSKKVADKKKKSGFSYIHVLQTANGNTGIWGKTNLDQKMLVVDPGVMIRITQKGKQETPNGDMYLFKVEIDKDNTIEVDTAVSAASGGTGSTDAYDEADVGEDETPADEVTAGYSSAPKVPATSPSASTQAKVKELLARSRNKTA